MRSTKYLNIRLLRTKTRYCYLQRQGICILPHENSFSIEEVANNFLRVLCEYGYKQVENCSSMELWYLISAHRLMMLYICTKFHVNNQRVSEFLSGCDLHTEICKRS